MAAGRPHKEIDRKQFENLCGIQCTRDEICAFFEVSDKTLAAWCKRTYGKNFSAVFAEKRGLGKISLRRAQYEKAMEGNPTMLIWLGRQYLGQVDKPEDSVDTEDTDAYFGEAGLK